MQTKKNKQLGKTIFFSIFLFGSIALILSHWVINFRDPQTDSPNYVRATYAIPTSQGFEQTLEALPTREHDPEHNGIGQGSNPNPSPTPTFNVDDWEQDEDISDDLADE